MEVLLGGLLNSQNYKRLYMKLSFLVDINYIQLFYSSFYALKCWKKHLKQHSFWPHFSCCLLFSSEKTLSSRISVMTSAVKQSVFEIALFLPHVFNINTNMFIIYSRAPAVWLSVSNHTQSGWTHSLHLGCALHYKVCSWRQISPSHIKPACSDPSVCTNLLTPSAETSPNSQEKHAEFMFGFTSCHHGFFSLFYWTVR